MRDTTHYHVLSGDHGYMPDNNIPCKTKEQALDCACSLAQELRAEGHKVHGKRADWHYEVERGEYPAGLEYIEVTECWEEGCMADFDE